MIEDTFIEVSDVRDNGKYGILFKVFSILTLTVFVIVLNAVPIMMGYNVIYFTGLVSFGLIYGLYVLIKRQNVMYEIEITNDNFRVGRIISDRKREELANFSVRDCEFIGPVTDDQYARLSEKASFVLNATANRKVEISSDFWFVYMNQGGVSYCIVFRFKPEMYQVFRRYNPRRVANYVAPVEEDEI